MILLKITFQQFWKISQGIHIQVTSYSGICDSCVLLLFESAIDELFIIAATFRTHSSRSLWLNRKSLILKCQIYLLRKLSRIFSFEIPRSSDLLLVILRLRSTLSSIEVLHTLVFEVSNLLPLCLLNLKDFIDSIFESLFWFYHFAMIHTAQFFYILKFIQNFDIITVVVFHTSPIHMNIISRQLGRQMF